MTSEVGVKDSSLVAEIDGDVLVYRSSFGAQKTRYNVQHGDKPVRTFETAKLRDAWLKEEGLTKADVTITPWVDVLDEGVAIHLAKKNLQHILDELGTEKYNIYLTVGEGNYRYQVATTMPYKGNREQPKPVHYEAVKKYYLRNGAIPVTDMEADDHMAVKASINPTKSVICTIDKDLNQVPGLHYDWDKASSKDVNKVGLKYKVTKEQGAKFFMKQLITGDKTDNIPGIPGAGPAKASTLIDCFSSTTEGLVSAFEAVTLSYESAGFDEAYMTEMGRLLWMKRSFDEPLWTPPKFLEYLHYPMRNSLK